MDYKKEIEALKEKIREANLNNIGNDEQLLREMKNELLLKQTQVNQLQKELDASNLENFTLTRKLDKAKSELKESEFNRKLSIKKQHILEGKLQEMTALHLKLSTSDKLQNAEIETLIQENGKLLTAKHQLSHEASELKEKLKYLTVFQRDLIERQAVISKEISKTKEGTSKLEAVHSTLADLHEELKENQEFINLSDFVAKNNSELKKTIVKLENLLQEKTAKLEKLQMLMFTHRYINTSQEDIVTKIKYLQFENRCKQLEEKNEIMSASYALLDHTLQKEIEANAQLIIKCEELDARIQENPQEAETELTK